MQAENLDFSHKRFGAPNDTTPFNSPLRSLSAQRTSPRSTQASDNTSRHVRHFIIATYYTRNRKAERRQESLAYFPDL